MFCTSQGWVSRSGIRVLAYWPMMHATSARAHGVLCKSYRVCRGAGAPANTDPKIGHLHSVATPGPSTQMTLDVNLLTRDPEVDTAHQCLTICLGHFRMTLKFFGPVGSAVRS